MPEFKNAKIHDPNCITLLCPSHHADKTRGRITNEQVKQYNDDPYCLQDGKNPNGIIRASGSNPIIHIGSVAAFVKSNADLLVVDNKSILGVEKPEKEGRPWMLNAVFHNKEGRRIATIKKNEITVYHERSWDVQVEGSRYKFRFKNNEISLDLQYFPPDKIVIHKLLQRYKGWVIESKGKALTLRRHNEGEESARSLSQLNLHMGPGSTFFSMK